MPTLLENSIILTPFEEIEDNTVLVDDSGSIAAIDRPSFFENTDAQRIDLDGKYLIPGFIDIHVHGGHGTTFGIGDLAERLQDYSQWIASFGETGFVMTIAGATADALEKTIKAYVKLMPDSYTGAEPLGLHLEGPFLNLEKHGAFNPDWIRAADSEEMNRYIKAGQGWIKHVTLAPDSKPAYEVAELLSNEGIIAALGHSNSDYENASKALSGDFRHITHSYNAQSPLHHRKPGVVGAVLASDKVTAELIADGRHVHPAAMKILVRCLGCERIILITDAMEGTGQPDGEYEIVGQKVIVKDQQATLPDGTIGGSTATINQCVRNMVKSVGVPLKDVVRMASYNPARFLGLDEQIGQIKTGYKANLAVIDRDINAFHTFVKGKLIYSRT